jgi:hypothetical protein
VNIVIIGGNEKMEENYKEICQKHNYDAKVFTKVSGGIRGQIGHPDRIIIFTATVAHKLTIAAKKAARRDYIPVTYIHSSSVTALEQALACGNER